MKITNYPENALEGNTEYVFDLGRIFDIAGNQGEGFLIHFTTVGASDVDKDGIPDEYELDHSNVLSPSDPDDAADDFDNDGLTNLEEYLIGTEPDDPDSDDDGIPDGKETEWGLDPTWPSDANGDLDNDTYTNIDEYEKGSDPLDPDSIPKVDEGSILPYLIIIVLILILVIAIIAGVFIVILRKRRGEVSEEEVLERPVEEEPEQPSWAEQEEDLRKECPFCNASLDLDMSYCPECGMTLPEDGIDEGSMDEDMEIGEGEGIPSMENTIMEEEILPSSAGIPEPEDDLIPPPGSGIDPPVMEEEI
jgi:hypothetical protein